MKYRKTAMAAISAGVAAALSLSAAGAATATPASHHSHDGKPKHHTKPKPKRYPQVTGSRLATALLPATAFGGDFKSDRLESTGGKLLPTSVKAVPATRSCKDFEQYVSISAWGDTAGAEDWGYNSVLDFSNPNVISNSYQNVLQFATPQAAAKFYGEEYAKYGACQTVTVADPSSTDGGTEELTNQSLTKTTMGKYQAFNLIQSDIFSDISSVTLYDATVVVLAGTNVYTVYEVNGTNDPVSQGLIGKLIMRVQGLYPRH